MTAVKMIAIISLILCTGCKVGPPYSVPANVGDEHWVAEVNTSAVDTSWWRSLNDPLLDELVHTSVAGNLDLKQAEARLREARADRDVTAGGRLPQLQASGSATRNGWSENGQIPIDRIPGFQRDYNLFEAGFDASWEIDLWGHTARAVEAARARAEGAEAARRETVMLVVTEVVRSYIDLRSAQQQMSSVRADSDAQAQIARLVGERYRAGEASQFDFLRADAQARSARAALPGLDANAHAAAYRLALLTAQPPESLAQKLLLDAPLPKSPSTVGSGMRSDLLRRRPDVLQAERALAASTADVGVATAELFPRLSLLGSVGQQSRTTGDFPSSASTYFSIGPSLHWPIFAGGTLRAQIRVANARAETAAAVYEQAVLTALSDSETALNRFASAQLTRNDRASALQQTEAALVLARLRYRAGEDDLIVLLDAQSAYSAAQQQSISADAAGLSALISLYKALGGGWESFEPKI